MTGISGSDSHGWAPGSSRSCDPGLLSIALRVAFQWAPPNASERDGDHLTGPSSRPACTDAASKVCERDRRRDQRRERRVVRRGCAAADAARGEDPSSLLEDVPQFPDLGHRLDAVCDAIHGGMVVGGQLLPDGVPEPGHAHAHALFRCWRTSSVPAIAASAIRCARPSSGESSATRRCMNRSRWRYRWAFAPICDGRSQPSLRRLRSTSSIAASAPATSSSGGSRFRCSERSRQVTSLDRSLTSWGGEQPWREGAC